MAVIVNASPIVGEAFDACNLVEVGHLLELFFLQEKKETNKIIRK
jgi:hypothetical protein